MNDSYNTQYPHTGQTAPAKEERPKRDAVKQVHMRASSKVAILIDGAFMRVRFRTIKGYFPNSDDVIEVCHDFIMTDPNLENDEIFRVYYYDSYPFDGVINNPISGERIVTSQEHSFQAQTRFLDDLVLKPKIALRSGPQSYDGWFIPQRAISNLAMSQKPVSHEDLRPKYSQKQIDIKIGLDIAWLSTKSIVDKIALVSGDSDFVPAMKFARREGVRIYLAPLEQTVERKLIEHADGVINFML